MAGHLGVNIDIAASVFLKGRMPLIDFILEVTGARSISDFEGPRKDRLARDLKGVMVRTTYRGEMKLRFKINGVSNLPAKEIMFENRDGKSISIVDYFKEVYNITLKYPYLPVVYKVNNVVCKGNRGVKKQLDFQWSCWRLLPRKDIKRSYLVIRYRI